MNLNYSHGYGMPKKYTFESWKSTKRFFLVYLHNIECETGGTAPSTNEIHNLWLKMINERLEIDKNLTNKLKYGKQHGMLLCQTKMTCQMTGFENPGF
jgi:hypothetical protein